ncbi:hypothetical protein K9L63_00830 [Candidatus Gracilibacteria bacterium]|nr:hypothetical protein [Candidatus Gracilibacteria bacterium]
MKSITGYVHGKINLTLDVHSKQPSEPFHPIRSILHKIKLADEIEISEHSRFSIEGDFDCPDEENLIWKAFQLLQSEYSTSLPPVRVQVKKNIPPRSGLGGGSADFACFVQLYHELFELGPITPKFIQKSADIGKDIPFFFEQKNCSLVEHFGEIVTPLPFDFSGEKVFLFFPPFTQSTAEAYSALMQHDTSFTEHFLREPSLERCDNSFDIFFNQKQYKNISDDFTDTHITGSGSAFFSFEEKNFPMCKKITTRLL